MSRNEKRHSVRKQSYLSWLEPAQGTHRKAILIARTGFSKITGRVFGKFIHSRRTLKKNPSLMYSTIRFGTASKATPQGRRLYRAGVGFKLAIKRSPARFLDHSATTSLTKLTSIYHQPISMEQSIARNSGGMRAQRI